MLAACTDGDGSTVIGTGGLNGPDGTNQNNPDGGVSHPDAAVTNPDAGSGSGSAASCPATGATDVGAPATFALNKPKYFSSGNFFVMRDSGGLYALTARCTHSGVRVQDDSGDFYCPGHGATFSYNGDPLSGPVSTGLKHYEMCTLSNGNVGVVTSKTVTKTERLVA
jgi:nitrite reductase/ring-hydroxylating ferredoxin subunit